MSSPAIARCDTNLNSTEPSRHQCLIYEGDPSGQLSAIVPFLSHSLRENWRSLYLGSPTMTAMVTDALSSNEIDVAYETRRGSLVISADRNHLGNGAFHPHELVECLGALTDAA